ncbi:hypothetical protein FNV43_RR08602 [Rhamnella rubrinervis]|uniref:Ubiquinol oxidase n=1 Tax=Rhamnella rubrinervis TaxID=2594499 RepID=A0A8K0H8X6_9ROSA|nr:hypothetical protein FNV43_RR08602 [Rhamnella rubrinervis]
MSGKRPTDGSFIEKGQNIVGWLNFLVTENRQREIVDPQCEGLPADSTLRDVVMVVRADEAHHRDVNHFASDVHYQGHELKDSPAPIGYH